MHPRALAEDNQLLPVHDPANKARRLLAAPTPSRGEGTVVGVEKYPHHKPDTSWRVALFEIGRPPIVLENPYPFRFMAWLAALPLRMRDILKPGSTWHPVKVPGFSTVRHNNYARWHHTPPAS